jgi:neutral ceramidase
MSSGPNTSKRCTHRRKRAAPRGELSTWSPSRRVLPPANWVWILVVWILVVARVSLWANEHATGKQETAADGTTSSAEARLPASKVGTPFRAGAATSNITPPLGGPIVGGFHPFPATHIHDELHARCLVLDDGAVKVALVVCDLLGADRALFDEARRLIGEDTAIPGSHVLMSATHTHSAVSALGANRFLTGQPLDEYQRFVARRIADGVRRAHNNLEPARIGWAVGQEPREVFNRRWFMKPGTVPRNPFGETTDQVKMNPPRGSPDLVRPAGPTDPEIPLIALKSLDGRPIALIANYALHYVGDVEPGHVSADYFGVFCDRVAQLLGADRQSPPFVALMSNGTSGNINNIDFARRADQKLPPYGRITHVGNRVAEAAMKAYRNIAWQDVAQLGATFRELELTTRRPTADQLARARDILGSRNSTRSAATLEEIYAERTVKMNEYPASLQIPLQFIRIGDVGIGGVPCEVFVETGLEFKERSPLKPGFIMEVANGYYGYLPTPEHHQLGGYETWLGTSRLEVGASEKILTALLEMANSLK